MKPSRFWRNTCQTILFSTLLSLAAPAANAADIQINITQPTANMIAAGNLTVRASVNSLYELVSVTAEVEGRQTNLTYSADASAWTNSMPLAGLSRGQKTLTVTAHDAFGGTTQTQRVFLIDSPPTLTVHEPANGTVVRQQLFIEAAAGDDGPAGAVISVYGPNNRNGRFDVLLMTGTNGVRGMATFPWTNVGPSTVLFSVSDSSGQTRYVPRKVIVEHSSNLVESAVAPASILDFSSERILYAFEPDLILENLPIPFIFEYSKPEPRILNRLTGNISTAKEHLPSRFFGPRTTIAPDYFVSGFLGSTGALLKTAQDSGAPIPTELFDWPETNGTSYGRITGGTNGVKVAGNTAAWISFDAPTIVLRDIVQTNDQFSIPLNAFTPFDLAPNLDLVYTATGHVFRSRPASMAQPYANRTTTQLTSSVLGYVPTIATDGTNVVFPSGSNIQLITPFGEEVLATNSSGPVRSLNGWVAFTKPGTSGQTQIWTRSPSGTLLQRTFFGSSSTLESLGPKGEVTFLQNEARYVSLPGAQPWWVNSGQGRVRWQHGKLIIILGRSLLEVHLGTLTCITLASGDSKLTYTGPAGLSYKLLGSSNLQDWSELLTFANPTGSVSWTNPPSPSYKFYRAVTAP